MVETGQAEPEAQIEQQPGTGRTLAEAQRLDKIELQAQAAHYRAMLSDIHAAIRNGNRATPDVIALVRDLIDPIVVIQAADSLTALLSENPQGTFGGGISGCVGALCTEKPIEKSKM
jgi:hypothetical protein